MKKILERLFLYQHLTREEAKEILGNISEGKYNPQEIAAFLTVFRMRNITVEELTGFRDCLHEHCIAIDFSDYNTIDLCGTGGDQKDTFNISTLASFVVAGAGYKVTKHGNYGVSSSCGSSNVMEYLGYTFTNNKAVLQKQLDTSGICFLHAPLFHPAMKEVAPIRKNIGVRTFFNMLGPMVNPSFPKNQLVGVFSLQLQRYYKYIYEQENCTYRIVHTLDGYDEISLTEKAKIITPTKEFFLYPNTIVEQAITAKELTGGNSVKEAANLFLSILNGKGTKAQNAVVITNAAMAIHCFLKEETLENAWAIAKEALESGAALNAFIKLLAA